ncbi:hypothetical protein D9M72_389640 [compost metagenome]
MPALQRVAQLAPGGFAAAALGLDRRAAHQQLHHAALPAARLAQGEQVVQLRGGALEVAQHHGQPDACALRHLADLAERPRGRGRMARVDRLQPGQRRLGGRQFAAQQAAMHFVAQSVGEQAIEPVARGVGLQPFEVGEGTGCVAGLPVGRGQHPVHAQHGIGHGDAFQRADLVLEQRARLAGVVEFVEHLGEQAEREVACIGARLAGLFGFGRHGTQHAFGLRHLAFHRIAQPDQAAALQAAGGGRHERCAIDHQRRRLALHAARLFVGALLDVEPRQDVVAHADRERIGVGRHLQQVRQHRQRGVGVVALQRQRGLQRRDMKAVRDRIGRQVACQLVERARAGVEVALEELRAHQPQPHAEAALHLFGRELAQQRRQFAQLSAHDERLRALLDQRGRLRRLARLHGMAHCVLQQAAVAKPGKGAGVHRLPGRLVEGGEAGQQCLAQQRMQAIPGLGRLVLDLQHEEVFALEPQQQCGDLGHPVGRTDECGAQRRADALAGRGVHEDLEFARRQA